MAIKEVTLSQDIENETGRYNEKTGWVRLYFNTDNGYIWLRIPMIVQKQIILHMI